MKRRNRRLRWDPNPFPEAYFWLVVIFVSILRSAQIMCTPVTGFGSLLKHMVAALILAFWTATIVHEDP